MYESSHDAWSCLKDNNRFLNSYFFISDLHPDMDFFFLLRILIFHCYRFGEKNTRRRNTHKPKLSIKKCMYRIVRS